MSRCVCRRSNRYCLSEFAARPRRRNLHAHDHANCVHRQKRAADDGRGAPAGTALRSIHDCGKSHGRPLRYPFPHRRCGPWWNFRDRTYVVTKEGVAVNGSAVYPWQDASQAPQQLQQTADKIKAMYDRFRNPNDPHVMHGRSISCREFHPETKSYHIYEFPMSCLIKSLCSAIPKVDSLRDGDPIDWNSPAGSYVKQQSKTSDLSNWMCWMQTQ